MFNRISEYLKAYCEPNSKQLRKDAFEAAKVHYKNKSHTVNEFLAFQRGYKGAYRRVYAQTKLSIMKGQ
jgi:hypothetical protein